MSRTCIDCHYWTFDAGHADWSDVTAGDSWSSGCDKGHWDVEGHEVSADKYRSALKTAEACKDFCSRETGKPDYSFRALWDAKTCPSHPTLSHYKLDALEYPDGHCEVACPVCSTKASGADIFLAIKAWNQLPR